MNEMDPKDLILDKKMKILKYKNSFQSQTESPKKHLKYHRFSATLKKMIKSQHSRIKAGLKHNQQSLLASGLIFSTLFVCAKDTSYTDTDIKNATPTEEIMPQQNLQTITQDDIDIHFMKMKQHGRFFVNPANDSITYRTNAELEKLGVGPVSHIGDISLARENAIAPGSDMEKLKKAYGQTGTYMGAYQFSVENIKSMLLFGLSQNESERIQKLCETALRQGIDKDNPDIQKFAAKFNQALHHIEKGESSKIALNEIFATSLSNHARTKAASLLKATGGPTLRHLVKELNNTDFEAFKELQDRYIMEVYIPLCTNQKDRKSIDLRAYAAFVAAEIHGHSSNNITLGKKGASEQIVAKEGNTSLMRKANNNICKNLGDNLQWLDLDYVEQCGHIGANIRNVQINLKKTVKQDLEQQLRQQQIFISNACTSYRL